MSKKNLKNDQMQACHAQKVSQYTCQSFNFLLKVMLFGWLVVQLILRCRSELWHMKWLL